MNRLALALVAATGGLALAVAIAAPAGSQEMAFPEGVPPQVNGYDPEPGGIRANPSSGASGGGGGGAVTTGRPQSAGPAYGPGSAASATTTVAIAPAGSAVEQMAKQSWGQRAIQESEARGINPEVVGAVARAESRFQNVDTAGKTSSATGPFQFVKGTFDEVSNRAGLGFAPQDRLNPEAQAVAGPELVRQYSESMRNGLGRSPTGAEYYASHMYGSGPGRNIAQASPDTPLSAFVSPRALQNNRQTGLTVGDYRAFAARRLGGAAGQPVFRDPGT